MTTTLPYFSAQQIHERLDYPGLIEALRSIFASNATAPVRHGHTIDPSPAGAGESDSGSAGGKLLLMPAWQSGAAIAVKVVTVFPNNRKLGVGTVAATVLLLDGATGHPTALLDGEALTLRRTGAASALASSYLSRPDSRTLLVVGAGQLAPYLAHAHCAIRQFDTVIVWARQAKAAQALAEQLRAEGLPAQAGADLAGSIRLADVITCATTSNAPLVLSQWVRPGTHVDLVGGFTPLMREADDELMARASVFVDTYAGALKEAGDLTQPMDRGLIDRSHVRAEFADLVTGRHAGRQSVSEVTLFKSVGSALEDLAAARLVLHGSSGVRVGGC